MRSYLATMDASGEIPFYTPGAYERGLDAGEMSGRSETH
jgi:hypothetical protein